MNLNVTKLISAVTLATLITCCASAQITKVGSGFRLRVNYKKGSTIKFNSISSIDSANNSLSNIKLKVPIKLAVLDYKQGVALVQLTMGAIVMNGEELQPEKSATFPLDNHNRTPVKGAKNQVIPFANGESALVTNSRPPQGTQGIGTALPDKVVHLGDTWKSEMPVNIGGRTEVLHGVYRFAGIKGQGPQAVGVVTYALSGAATGTGTMMMLTRDGTLFSNETKLNMTGGMIRLHQTMTRL